VAVIHPVARMFDETGVVAHAYGASRSSFGELYMAFERTNFRLDAVHELTDRRDRTAAYPAVLVVRARKQGV
jgi:hypothetical protein